MKLCDVLPILNQIAPLETAEDWDNVGLLVGNYDRFVQKVMTCLTVTDTTLTEAIQERVNLIVSHHPIPFKPHARITSDNSTGSLLLKAIENKIAIYSPHTAWDNAQQGINQQLADILRLQSIKPLKGFAAGIAVQNESGIGRCGYTPEVGATIATLMAKLRESLPSIHPRQTHELGRVVKKIGIVCGSGGSLLALVASRGCDALLTGEATYHQCLEAESRGIAMLMIGHHASEAFAMSTFAQHLAVRIGPVEVFASKNESSSF